MGFINLNLEAEKSKNSEKPSRKNLLSGIYRIKTKKFEFDMLTIKSDDSSIVNRFWDDKFSDYTFEKWCSWTEEKGFQIDVGAHTGLFTIAALKSNQSNIVISVEPFQLNYNRIITNLRLNNYNDDRAKLLNVAASNQNKDIKFEINTPWSYLSKGGKISDKGLITKAIRLDSINFNPDIRVTSLKIDTEGEDLSVLEGARNLIKKNMPNIIIETRKENIKIILKIIQDLGYSKIYDKFQNKFYDKKIYDFEEKKGVKDLFCEK